MTGRLLFLLFPRLLHRLQDEGRSRVVWGRQELFHIFFIDRLRRITAVTYTADTTWEGFRAPVYPMPSSGLAVRCLRTEYVCVAASSTRSAAAPCIAEKFSGRAALSCAWSQRGSGSWRDSRRVAAFASTLCMFGPLVSSKKRDCCMSVLTAKNAQNQKTLLTYMHSFMHLIGTHVV